MKRYIPRKFLALLLLLPAGLFAQPGNDDVCDASFLVVDDPATLFDNTGASVEPGEPTPPPGNCITSWCDGQEVEGSVWFSFTAPSNGAVIITTCLLNTDIDTQIALWEVGDCDDFGTFGLLGANDDLENDCDSGGNIYASTTSVDGLNPGETYYIQVDGYDMDEGEFEIQVGTGIPSSFFNFIHNSADLGLDLVDIRLDGELIADDLEYQTNTGYVEIPAGITYTITLHESGSVDDSDPLFSIDITPDASQDYVAIVSGIFSDSGYDPMVPLTLEIYENAMMNPSAPGMWDILFFQGITDLDESDVEIVELGGTAVVDDIQFGEYNSDGYFSVPVANYSFDITDNNGTSTGNVFCAPFGLFGQGFAGTIVTSGFADPSANSNGPAMGLFLVNPFDGDFIELFPGPCPVPANDFPCDAVELIVNAAPVTFDNVFATGDDDEVMPPNLPLNDPEADCIYQWCDGGAPDNSLWFRFIAPATGTAGITTCFANSFDTQLGVWSVGTCSDYNTFDYIAANDDADGGCGAGGSEYAAAFIVYGLVPTQEYYIQLDGWGGETGEFDIQVLEFTGISGHQETAINVYPNPAYDQLNVTATTVIHSVRLKDMAGRILMEIYPTGNAVVDISELASGVYLVDVSTSEGTKTIKAIVE